MILKFEELPIERHCMICGVNYVGGIEDMKIMRNSNENLISFAICENCRADMLEELEDHIRI